MLVHAYQRLFRDDDLDEVVGNYLQGLSIGSSTWMLGTFGQTHRCKL